MPNVLETKPKKRNIERINTGGSIRRSRIKNDDHDDDVSYVSVDSLKNFLYEMERSSIVTVFNIRVDKDNTFTNLSSQEVSKEIERFENTQIPYAHAVYSYPNFTLTRELPGFKPFKGVSDEVIALPEIFVDAAYPAAGLLVASQQPKVLAKRGLKIIPNNVCVRVDLENAKVKKNLTTNFNRESALRWNDELLNTIGEKKFGFAFCSDEV